MGEVITEGESGQGQQRGVTPSTATSTTTTTTVENGKAMDNKQDAQKAQKTSKPMKGTERVKEVTPSLGAYQHEELQEKPSQMEVIGWHIYGLCSYFIQTVLIPMVFPLIISQLVEFSSDPVQEWVKAHNGTLSCATKEVRLHYRLTQRLIIVGHSKFSPLEWTSLSWLIGLILAAPILASISFHLDHGQDQSIITMASTGIGAIFCLPAGFFKTVKIFPPYIAAIIAAVTVATASHTRNFGLMLQGYVGPTIRKSEFSYRQKVSSWLSLCSTAAGYLGAAVMSAFTYHMLHDKNERDFISLWVVSIFSGLIWMIGIIHALTCVRSSFSSSSPSIAHAFSIFRYPYALGALAAVFLSSFTTMIIFMGGLLFLVGQLCIKPVFVLYFCLTYFLFPMLLLPLMQPLKQLMKADAAKMQVLGFLLCALTTGFGFYFRNNNWHKGAVLVFGAIQGTSAGLLHAFGRVLFLDCTPSGKEGSFSVWFSFVRSVGLCAGFTVGSVAGNIRASFGTAFCTAVCGIMVLIFSNMSDLGGAVAAGCAREDNDQRTPSSRRLDTVLDI